MDEKKKKNMLRALITFSVLFLLITSAVIICCHKFNKNSDKQSKLNSTTKQLDESITEVRNNLVKDLHGNLLSVQKYLNGLDSVVVGSGKKLQNLYNQNLLNSLNECSDDIYSQIKNNLSIFNQQFTQMDNSISDLKSILYSDNKEVIVEFTDINKHLSALEKSVRFISDQSMELYKRSKKMSKEQWEETALLFENVLLSICSIDKQMQLTEESLLNALNLLEIKDQKRHIESLNEIKQIHMEIKSSYSVMTEMLLSQMDLDHKDMQTETLKLKEKMDGIHTDISVTQSDILSLLEAMDHKNVLRDEEILESLQNNINNVNNKIYSVQTQINTAHEQINQLLTNLQESGQNSHEELLFTIHEMSQNFENVTDLSMQEIVNSFSSISDIFNTGNKLINDQLNDISIKVTGQLDRLEQQIAQTDTSYQNGTENILDKLIQMQHALEQDIQSVFQQVSSGKSILASALLTKGVSVSEHATFAQIKDAILNIPQKLVIGVQEIPGTINYDYHYHVDNNDDQIHADHVATSGGCYTNPKYHSHTSAQGCYRTEYYHEHSKSCPGKPVYVDWVDNPYWGWTYTCGDQPQNGSRDILTCSKNSGSIDWYVPACGLSDGQIIGATISYNKDVVQKNTAQVNSVSGQIPYIE